jgi:TetR/AcrR family transcriptional regulator
MDDSTRNKIMAAAWTVFSEKGYDGARMNEIAETAGANKAMIYYYFTSKDELYKSILRETFQQLFGAFRTLETEDNPEPAVVISDLVKTHIHFLQQHPHLPNLLVREINRPHNVTHQVLKEILLSHDVQEQINRVLEFLSVNAANGKLRPIDPPQTLWSIIGLNITFFILKPILQTVWEEELRDEDRIVRKRADAVVDLVLNGVIPAIRERKDG